MPSEAERITALEKDMEHLMGNGQPGVISEISDRLRSVEQKLWIAFGAILAAAFLTGNGTLTLDHLLKMFSH